MVGNRPHNVLVTTIDEPLPSVKTDVIPLKLFIITDKERVEGNTQIWVSCVVCSYDRLKAKTAISITPIPESPTRATQFLRGNEISKSSTSLHPCFPPTLALS